MNIDDKTHSAVFHELESRAQLPPSRISLPDLISAGRRRQVRRRLAVGATGVVGIGLSVIIGLSLVPGSGRPATEPWAAGAGGAGSAARCTIARLPMPGGSEYVEVVGIAPAGRYVAGNTGSPARPLVWNGDSVTTVNVAGAWTAESKAVNDSGVVVGSASHQSGQDQFPWAYVAGRVVNLPLPDGYTGGEATAVNGRGDVVGNAWADDRAATAVVWRNVGGEATVGRLTAPGSPIAFGISDSGSVVGELQGVGAYAWDPDGHGRQLPDPAGTEGGRAQDVRGDWAFGAVSGKGHSTVPPIGDPSGGPQGSPVNDTSVLWNLRSGQVVTVAGGTVGAVASTGVAVVNDPKGASVRAVDGQSHPLPDLVAGGASKAIALSDDGAVIAGTSLDGSRSAQPVRWQC